MRQKTPHPKELKAKAHKLFGGKKDDHNATNEEAQHHGDAEVGIPAQVMFNNHTNMTSTPQNDQQNDHRISFDQAPAFDEDEDDDEVGKVRLFKDTFRFSLSLVVLNFFGSKSPNIFCRKKGFTPKGDKAIQQQ